MMRDKKLMLIMVLIAMILLSGCRSINVGGTGQIGTVTGGGSINIPVLRADDPSSADTQE